ncbi:MAG: TatD family hydrolase [Bacteroidales bacterium]|nr:TatD family hydrolase [Bacteroidales bacterium]
MKGPGKYDFINIHDHGAQPAAGIFTVDNIMVHEDRYPEVLDGIAYSCGIHPWYIDEGALEGQLSELRRIASMDNVIALGEAGFDRIKGAESGLQEKAFIMQADLSEEMEKPLFIHCVKGWDELLKNHKEINPRMRWIIHGFRGKPELAGQLLDKGFYLSPWVEWAIRPASKETIKSIPPDRLFLETDGFDIGIEPVYEVVAGHLGMETEKLKEQLWNNFNDLFALNGR